jgi:TRAP-type uncharacterized transport system substrate-binding protein
VVNLAIRTLVSVSRRRTGHRRPVYTEGEIPAETYGTAATTSMLVVPNVLLVRDDLDDGTACALTRLVYENVDALTDVHVAAAAIDVSIATEIDPIPLHPGAEQALEGLLP